MKDMIVNWKFNKSKIVSETHVRWLGFYTKFNILYNIILYQSTYDFTNYKIIYV